jgi:hypothetical protein
MHEVLVQIGTAAEKPAELRHFALAKTRGFDATPKAFVFNMLRSVSKIARNL